MAKPIIRMPETIEECTALREWAESVPVERPMPATEQQITKHLAFLSATLPSKAIDNETAKKRFAVYVSILDGHGNDALGYMAREACKTLEWFPTPKQCLELLAGWRAPTSDKEVALGYCHKFSQARFEEFMATLDSGHGTPEMLTTVPERWCRVAEVRGYLRYDAGGGFVIRAPYQKPRSAPAASGNQETPDG